MRLDGPYGMKRLCNVPATWEGWKGLCAEVRVRVRDYADAHRSAPKFRSFKSSATARDQNVLTRCQKSVQRPMQSSWLYLGEMIQDHSRDSLFTPYCFSWPPACWFGTWFLYLLWFGTFGVVLAFQHVFSFRFSRFRFSQKFSLPIISIFAFLLHQVSQKNAM